MKEKCRKIMERFYAVDKGHVLPSSVSTHLLTCKECRARVRLLTKAEQLVVEDLKKKEDVDSEEITKIVNLAMEKQKDFIKVSFRSWGVSGFFLLLFCVLLSFISNDTYPMIEFCASIFSGLTLSFYIMSFIGANLDIFVKKTRKFDTGSLLSV